MSEVMKYKKLQVCNKAIELVVHVYALIKKFPREEQFALGDQLRRALISVPSNIAEGMGRVSTRDRAHFVEIAYGSLMEVNCQLEIAMKLGYISIEELSAENKECEEIARMLSGLRASLLSTLDS